jgi:hypothetical protein
MFVERPSTFVERLVGDRCATATRYAADLEPAIA